MAPPRITFGHGSRHVLGRELSPDEVERAIEADVRSSELLTAAPGYFSLRTIEIEGRRVEYHAYVVQEDHINIGTYFLVR